jgi:glycosyltransferase involved in cell wall biosynthesis
MASSLVSVIVPAFQAARFIERTLESALGQTHAELEIIVVDDGSTDQTRAIVERVAGRDARVRLIRQANGGVSRARNVAIAQARGAYIAPLDADDLWHPTKIEKQLRCFRNAPESTGVVYCHFAVIDEDDRVMLPRRIYHAPTGHVYPHLAVGNIVGNASAPLVKRSLLESVGGYDEDFREGCEDLDFYLRLAECSDYALVPEFLVGYRRSRDSMSMNIAKMERAVAQTTDKVLKRHPTLPRRLLRWRNGNMYRYLALHALMGADYRRGLVLAGKSVMSDPLLLLGWALNRTAGRRGLEPAETAAPPNYYALDPVPTGAEDFRPSRLEARRQAAAARMRIDRLAA